MSDESPGDVTALLRAVSEGESQASNELMDLVYRELRAIAHRQMCQVAPDHTLQPTALVHEAYFRLFGKKEIEWKNRHHFFWAAARAMHDVLVEQARKSLAQKRGGNHRRIALNDDLSFWQQSDQLLALSEALERLKEAYPDTAAVVMLRFFGGMNHAETAAALGVSEQTVRRRWTFAKAWLHQTMTDDRVIPETSTAAPVSAFPFDSRLGMETIDAQRGPDSGLV